MHGRTGYYLVLLAVVLLIPHITAFAQERDPYAVEARDRTKASLPLAYGFIVGGIYPAASGTGDGGPDLVTRFNIAAYLDTWQLGFAKKDYGNMFSLMMRTVGRDIPIGWFIEYGSKSVDATIEIQSQDRDTTFTSTSYGLGFLLSSGFSDRVKLYWHYGTTVGFSSVDGVDKEDNDEDRFGSASQFYFDLNAGIGARIPAGPLGIVIMGTGTVGLLPAGLRFSESSTANDQAFFYSFGIGTNVAFNLQID
jgi:hypothetical protein